MAEERAVHIMVMGRVQGVGYRKWLAKRASSLGLSGWARNLSDGAVEAVLSGPSATVKALLIAAREGPPNALVQEVKVIDEVPLVYGSFEVRETV
ncbi:acylphosphatase [Roseibium hamelinense]|uniref:acylphosphatase n=1 Tax=Roseibium hamelinense TaxID=150831 RepID=A0A562SGY4_9HYPH|nr:acylphosphatase [Roseibium hamelinense]MTI44161.1 acylphosphatase [Roseibium hamelinense]TWI80056.1 acylphosphatase [Roseibium hamelinense]